MNIKEIIPQLAAMRDEVQAAIAEAKTAAPHLCNAAGALHAAITNLEGHLAAQAAAKPVAAE